MKGPNLKIITYSSEGLLKTSADNHVTFIKG